MRTFRISLQTAWCAVTALSLLCASQGLAADPQLRNILPRGVQRGTEAVMTFTGARLQDAEEILFYDPGFELKKVEGQKDNQVTATVLIAPNCRLGEHTAKVRTKSGMSELRKFFVGPYPQVDEKEPNTDFATPQPIPMNCTVAGVIQNEDVDYFVVEAKKGQRLSVEVEGMRMANTMFDPYVAILNMERFELAAVDDSSLLLQDPVASVVIPEDGQYVISLRESSYRGDGNCFYRMHVGNFPRPTVVYPSGGKAGTEVEFTFLGDPVGEFKQTIKLPDVPQTQFPLEPGTDGLVAPSPNYVRVSSFDNVLEVEPNPDFNTATKTELVAPLALNGIIGEPGDVDCFRFQAKKGQVFEVRCHARGVRSPLDPVMNLYDGAGKGIAGNDDSGGPDSYFRFNVPADGEYILRITDHLGRGGKEFVYRVEFEPLAPTLTVSIPKYARYSQTRHQVVVPRGNRFAQLVQVRRANIGGEVVMSAEGMPQGMTMQTETMAANVDSVPMLFEAAPDAPIAGNWGNIVAKPADPNVKVEGRFEQSYELIISAPGQSVFQRLDVNKLAFAVTEEVPFKIEIVQPKVPIVQDGSMDLKVIAHRNEGFTAPIQVQFPFRPPGVGATSAVTIPEGKNEVLYPLSANGNAPIREWKVVALGQSNVGGAVWVSSQLATLEVAAPYVGVQIEMAAVEQGQTAEVVCKLNQQEPFEGKAVLKLLGLPAKCTTNDIEITKDDKEAVFTVATAPDSPAGQHKTLFCQLIVTKNGEPIVHVQGRGGVLRIDPPPPPKKDEPMPAAQPQQVAKKEEPAKKPEKRLTRLEQLRLEQEQRAKQAQAGGG